MIDDTTAKQAYALSTLLRAARERRDAATKGEDRSTWATAAQSTGQMPPGVTAVPLLARLQLKQADAIRQLAQLADAIELLLLDPTLEQTLIAMEPFRYL